MHDGPCRWPHDSAIDAKLDPALFRALFVTDEAEAAVVRDRIECVLRSGAGWRLISLSSRGVAEAERPLAERLLAGHRLAP